MGASVFEHGAEVLIEGVSHRVHRKINESDWQLEESRTKRIITLAEREVLRKYADGALTLPGTGDLARCGPANSALPEKDFEIAKIRRAYVMRVLDVPNSRDALESAIAEVWEKIKMPPQAPAYSTVYRWKRRYVAAKADIRSLVDNTSAKGNRSSRYAAEVLAICEQAIQTKWMRRERNTIQDTVEEAVFRVIQENKLRPEGLGLREPTRRLITRLVAKIPAVDKCAARHGREAGRKLFRSVKGHIVTQAPLDRAEIDHTILDLFVVDDRTRLPLGRPFVTACIDDHTRCILGVHVGFTPPGFHTVAMCLKGKRRLWAVSTAHFSFGMLFVGMA